MHLSEVNKLKNKGFTLIELIVGLAIMGIISVMISGILSSGLTINSVVKTRNDVQSDLSVALAMISDNLRKAQEIDKFDNNGNVNIDGVTRNYNDIITNAQNYNYQPLVLVKEINNNISDASDQKNWDMYLYAFDNSTNNLYRFKLQYQNNNSNNSASIIKYTFALNSDQSLAISTLSYADAYYIYNSNNLIKPTDHNTEMLDQQYYVQDFPEDEYDLKEADTLSPPSGFNPIMNYNDGSGSGTSNSGDLNNINYPTKSFFYRSGQDIYLCFYKNDNVPTNTLFGYEEHYYTIKLIKNYPNIQSGQPQLVIGSLVSTPKFNTVDGNSYQLIMSKEGQAQNGSQYTKTINTNIALGNYRGDWDEK